MSTDTLLSEPRYEVRLYRDYVFVRYIYRDHLNRRCTDYVFESRIAPYRDTKADAILFAQALAARDGAAFVNLLNNNAT